MSDPAMDQSSPKTLLERRLDPLREPFRDFIGAQTTAGALLILAIIAALFIFNLSGAHVYRSIGEMTVGFMLNGSQFSTTLHGFTNEALIAVFFFLIGLEIKRELIAGELQEPAKRRMLVVTAAGGMAAPAAIYAGINLWSGQGDIAGWGIPMATDTALAIGILAMLDRRLVKGAAAFLVGLAIVDDIGAVVVIALFYSDTIRMLPLLIAAGLLAVGAFINYAGVRHPFAYMLLGILLWIAIHNSGIHAGISGILTAATVPARPRMHAGRLLTRLRKSMDTIHPEASVLSDPGSHDQIESIATEARMATTPLRRWERRLDLPVALFILPLFAFLNAGVPLDPALLHAAMLDPVTLGIMFGLILGKPLGIVASALLASRMGLGKLPDNLNLRHLIGLGLLAGIGFTMATFIADLALPAARLELAKIAILSATLVAGLLGYGILRWASSR
ncbi:MAG: Na+/H+ antiporter NhaA [Candidatus Thiodiazotropha sp.]